MTRKLFMLVMAAVLCAAATWAWTRYPDSPPEGISIGLHAPEFSLVDTKMQEWQLLSLGRRPALLFFSCGCPQCANLLRELKLRLPSQSSDAQVLVISSSTPAELEHIRAAAGNSFPVLFDPYSRTSARYQASRCPKVFVLDRMQRICTVIDASDRPAQECALQAVDQLLRASAS